MAIPNKRQTLFVKTYFIINYRKGFLLYSPAMQARVSVEAGVVIDDRALLLEFQIGT